MSTDERRAALVESLRYARSLPREWPWPDAPVVIPARLWREHLDDCDAAAEMLANAAPVDVGRVCSWCGVAALETSEENACALCVRHYGLAATAAGAGVQGGGDGGSRADLRSRAALVPGSQGEADTASAKTPASLTLNAED